MELETVRTDSGGQGKIHIKLINLIKSALHTENKKGTIVFML